MRTLAVRLNGRPVGTLHESDDLWSFEYDDAWVRAADGFDLSPSLPRSARRHADGGSDRPVQWYFDNLLPEEGLREVVSREADIRGDDAFALLEYLGAESAGSLVLLPPDKRNDEPGGLRALPDGMLSSRIRDLPRATLTRGAPKRMSAAGAQHKLLVVYRDGELFEPVGSQPSTHILKPNHPGDDYPASVINEYLAMRLAGRLGLPVPPVHRRYTPEPVYIVERFDRHADRDGNTTRHHVIDACQLLNKARGFKYKAATLDTLADIVGHCRNRASTRMALFRWLVFNVLAGNHDNHLKNLSFRVSEEGFSLAPAYDLLSTAVYDTRAFANERARWPAVEMSIALPGATTFGAVTRQAVLDAGEMLGLTRRVSERELGRFAAGWLPALNELAGSIEAQNAALGEAPRRFLAGEMRLIRVIQHVVAPEMLARVS
jgi:serine/threonine-protein kinase HipA